MLAAALIALFAGGISVVSDYDRFSGAHQQLQSTANDAALAAVSRLIGEGRLGNDPQRSLAIADAYATAGAYVRRSVALNGDRSNNPESANEPDVEVTVGYVANPKQFDGTLSEGSPARFNALTIQVRQGDTGIGSSPFLLASLFGISGSTLHVQSTAAINTHVRGFRIRDDENSLNILPFALDEKSWQELVNGNTYDDWSWNVQRRVITHGPDGLREVNLYPADGETASKRGTLYFSKNSSRSSIAQQILHGITASDLNHRKGRLAFDRNKRLKLPGETGISVGVQRELQLIRGEPRILPVFRSVTGSEDQATYTIVKFVGVRVMNVKLSGNPRTRHVLVQPAAVVEEGAITTSDPGMSELIFTPPNLLE